MLHASTCLLAPSAGRTQNHPRYLIQLQGTDEEGVMAAVGSRQQLGHGDGQQLGRGRRYLRVQVKEAVRTRVRSVKDRLWGGEGRTFAGVMSSSCLVETTSGKLLEPPEQLRWTELDQSAAGGTDRKLSPSPNPPTPTPNPTNHTFAFHKTSFNLFNEIYSNMTAKGRRKRGGVFLTARGGGACWVPA